jgi:hypothetical protein
MNLKKHCNIIFIYFIISLFPSLATAESNYIANYTNVNSDTVTSQASISNAISLTGDAFASLGFFTVTPTISGSFPNYVSNYFQVCFGDNWKVESPSGNSIFNAKIKAYNEVIVSCIGFRGSVTLHAYGQCKYIGLKRVCGRFTGPCENDNDRCCGSDSCGAPSSSSKSCPNCKQESAYRICAYYDPPIPIDPNDNNYDLMPFHKNTPAPPAVTGGDNLVVIGAMIVAAGLFVPGLGAGAIAVGGALMLAGGIMELIEVITSTINYVVFKNVGCIDVPLAPSPPPFFSPLIPANAYPGVISICKYSPKYYLDSSTQSGLLSNGYTQAQIDQMQYKQNSTSDDLCENGGTLGSAKQYSTYENPAVRIHFSNPLPICATQSTYDVCVMGSSLDSPKEIQTDNNGLLPVCSESIINNCVRFPSGRATGGPFRTNYSLTASSALGASGFVSNPVDTTYVVVDPSLQSLALKGIDDAEYVDSSIGNTVTAFDTDGQERSFYVSLNDSGDQVCVTDKTVSGADVALACVDRPLVMNPPSITPCPTSTSCGYSGQDISTQPRMSISLGSPAKTAIMGIDTTIINPEDNTSFLAPTAFCAQDDIVTSGNSSSNQAPCYIYGSQFTAYITDADNQTPATSSNGTITPNIGGAEYVGGIQYSQGVYCRGATKLCLSGYNNPGKVVVAKIIELTNSDTGTTELVVSDKISDRVIPASSASLPLNPNTLFNKETGYITGSTQITRLAYGFQQSPGGEYYENSACTSNGRSCIASSVSYPTSTICTCPDYTTTPTSTYSCTIQGCEYAFEVSDGGTKTTSYTGYTDGFNQYLLSDGNGYGERPLNPLEQGLCTDITQPTCPAITSPGTNDGLATWPKTDSGLTATGTCLGGTETADGNAPTRQCLFVDSATNKPNGCPETQGLLFTSVTNACGATVPTWWPSEFLYEQSKFQGAIINMFNVTPYYMRSFTPQYNNYNQITYAKIRKYHYNSAYIPEQWVTTNWHHCKEYGGSIDINRTPRSHMNGDQEMLFITQANWRNIWMKDWDGDGEPNDLTWLLDSVSNGCYVYNVNNYVSTTKNNLTVGLKICKSGSKVSFSLVDLSANGSTSYTNTAYIMQSNIVAYDRISTSGQDNDWHGMPLKTEITNSVNSNTDTNLINHGFVVQTTGFSSPTFDSSLIKSPPSDFISNNTTENMTVKYGFTGYYKYDTSRRDYRKTTNFYNSGVAGEQGGYNPAAPTTVGSCALSNYRQNTNYSGSVTKYNYFIYPSTTTYNGSQLTSYPYSSFYISSQYVYTGYNGSHKDNPWPRENYCNVRAEFKNFVSGNSAKNPHMFLWSSPTDYRICN